jgi:hypothetical protein
MFSTTWSMPCQHRALLRRPPPCHHRNHLRRPHRRTPGPHPLGTLRRQLRVGDLARPSPTTCYAPPAPSPEPATAAPAAPPCAVTWSTSPPAWPDLNAARSCTYPPTGPGNPHGSPCGTTPSADDPAPNHRHPTRRPGPTGKAGQTSSQTTPTRQHNQDQTLNSPPRGRSVESG